MVVRSVHAVCEQLTHLNLGVVHLIRFKQVVDAVPFAFK